MIFFWPICRAWITYRGFSSWVAVLMAHALLYSVTEDTRTDPTSKNSCSYNDRFSMFAALIIYWSRLTQRVGERIVCVNLNLDDAIVKDRLTDNIQDINHLKSCAPRIPKNFDALGFFLLDERVLSSGDITSLIKNLLFLCVRSFSIRLSHARVNAVALTRAIW